MEEIVELFKGCCRDVQISDDEFEYDSLPELTKRGQRLKNLTISSDSPPLSLTITKSKTELFRGGSILTIPAYTQIQELLRHRRRPVLTAFLYPVTAISFVVAILAFISFFGKSWPPIIAFVVAPPIAAINNFDA